MREVGRDLLAWIAEGAHIYVCGDAKRMAKDVERALVDIVAQYGARATAEAVAFVAELKKTAAIDRMSIDAEVDPSSVPSHHLSLLRRRLRRARTPDGRGGAIVAGDPHHPANFGRLCSKGSALRRNARRSKGDCCIR